MMLLPPRSTRTETLLPDTTLFRSDGPGKLQINAKWGEGRNASAEINISEKPFFSFSHDSKGSVLNWSHELFLPKTGDANWLEPDASVWDLLSWLPWKEVAVNTEIRPSYRIERRSEEHTSELQSLMRISYAVFCLKKKTSPNKRNQSNNNKHPTKTKQTKTPTELT